MIDDAAASGIDPVSIHVPLAEHDRRMPLDRVPLLVSIHVPLAEHDNRNR